MMYRIAPFKKRILCMLLAAAILTLFVPFRSFTAFADALPEPEPHSDAYLQTVHIGQTVSWQPYREYPELSVSYSSSDPDIIQISKEGKLTVQKEGSAELTASTPGNENYSASSLTIFMEALSSEEGLYLSELDSHFYYQGAFYGPGELPLETERELCKRVPSLKVFLEDYLEPYQSKIPDRTEAALTALLNYAENYYTRNFAFAEPGGFAETGKTQWMELLRTHKGLCAPTASLFCYLMYLAGLPAMEEDSTEDHRAHAWCLIEHDGFYYNFEEYDFMLGLRERYAIPPFSAATAAYFQNRIYAACFLHFPVPGASFTPDQKVEDMGRDLSEACPVLMYERLSDGTYRARFETIRKGRIPAYEDGTPLTMEELTYKNMESDPPPGADGADNQANEYAKPLFEEASRMLFREISGLFDTQPKTYSNSPETGEREPFVPRELLIILSAAAASSCFLLSRKK